MFGCSDNAHTKSDRLAITVDLKKWFEGVDLSSAETEENEIILGDGNNSNLVERLGDNFESSIKVTLERNSNDAVERIELRGEDEEDNP